MKRWFTGTFFVCSSMAATSNTPHWQSAFSRYHALVPYQDIPAEVRESVDYIHAHADQIRAERPANDELRQVTEFILERDRQMQEFNNRHVLGIVVIVGVVVAVVYRIFAIRQSLGRMFG
jgi:hypothetical protein